MNKKRRKKRKNSRTTFIYVYNIYLSLCEVFVYCMLCTVHQKKSESNLGVKEGNNVSCKCERDFHLCTV